ncbi:serine/threonine-protein kinase [Marinobacter nauticus]|uniref:serine/threonine-protein kinase n=1 Tax=Marinobacter nauticus TaxID=2743 RepID=UPI001CFF32DE|nr:serine/threonine-protein kinase [Marinobacter nauticus]
MSTVVKYLDRHLDRIVVLKTIDNDEDKHRLYDEIVALMSLRSNHVVQIYDVVIGKDGLSGFIEEFIDGEDLINHNPETSDEVIKIIWQIAAGIRDIHSKDVIHRDIKPQNIKVDNEGIVKIFDFGLAKVNADSASTIGVKGTPLYSAPELMKGGHVPLTKATDVYSFAVTCAQICGVDPFHFNAKNGTLSGIFKHQKTISDPKLINLLDECINDIPENRPSIEALEERLR